MNVDCEILDMGKANYMGDDVWLLQQDSPDGPQSVAVTRADLERMLAAN